MDPHSCAIMDYVYGVLTAIYQIFDPLLLKDFPLPVYTTESEKEIVC
jgi:hypothetical protein